MKLDTQKGVLTFNSCELEQKTVSICTKYLQDALKRAKILEQAKTKKQTEKNQQQNGGLAFAIELLKSLDKSVLNKTNTTFDIFVD